MISLYPIRFQPILKHYLWGGNNLAKLFKNKKISSQELVAESWEITDLDSEISVVANGPLKGKTLRELLSDEGERILGEELYQKTGGKFPILVKLIDAQKKLSLQVHPDEDYAKKNEPGQRGKTEMWYLLQTEPQAQLMCGFKGEVTRQQFEAAMKKDQYEGLLQSYTTQPGDVYFVPAGTVHAIDKGNILLEIQVASNLTYRIYDWGRVDAKGKPRPTHREKAFDVIKFDNPLAAKKDPKPLEATSSLKKEELLSCSQFAVEKWDVTASVVDPHSEPKCLIYCVVQGEGTLQGTQMSEEPVPFSAGDTFLIPAALGSVKIIPKDSDSPVAFLRVLPY